MRMRVGVVAVLAVLLLPAVAGGALAVPAVDPPAPTPEGAQLSARPGERLTFTVASYLPGRNGDWVVSEIFVEHGTLRMNDPVITAVATVACDTPPGVYPVERTGPGGPAKGAKGDAWVTVKVADIGEAERKACPGMVAALPPDQPEERWPAGDSWPQSSWDVRTFRPGERVTLTGSDADLMYGDTLTSPGFTNRPVMHGAKAVMTVAVIRCDAEPGLYKVRWVGTDQVWARYRVARTHDTARRACGGEAAKTATGQAAAWLLGAGTAALAAAGAVTWVLVRRRRNAFR
ncbi:hypothetical protein [Streptomyces sp. NBC_01006]|uniref:hypothetical protein n=1 Tax=Streptomyces sp. NBC_01006 TaxID=2903716 RepID=UPI00386CD8C4|nr:hypothetical protein OG509_01405 [Streptomyces sp. NBC_01006]